MKRRTFLAATVATAATANSLRAADEQYRVAIIGHTGRGNYGHGIDTVWLAFENTKICAVADPNPAGRAKALERLQTKAGFEDYRKMLRESQPDIVAICPRHVDQHHAMCLAAIEAGARGIYLEKPFCRTPQEADEIKAACKSHNVKLAVAHRNRYHPTLKAIDEMIATDQLGKILEIRGRGKGDRRGGAEDLWVLGTHVLDLIHYFGGKPLTCSAVMQQDGRRVTKADIVPGNEGLGPLAGNALHARYQMEKGFPAYFDSIANDGTQNAGFGLQLIGNRGIVAIRNDRFPIAHFVPGNPFLATTTPRPWIPITSAGPGKPEPVDNLNHLVGHHIYLVRDLLASIQEDRQPICGVHEAAMTIEMVCAVFASHVADSRAVPIPLSQRGNALASW